ncbi:hypothetical protein BGZ97_011023 [Linnemannia gamsii]|uniref:Uncharacterized protein n=1 Tax=Linnemannia gamsii TaxID=64522 RepID=A0A9P6RLZ4_9FUNG|nr:hypothetical protein BGZ97_011023 [Linnemannia gamsii]
MTQHPFNALIDKLLRYGSTRAGICLIICRIQHDPNRLTRNCRFSCIEIFYRKYDAILEILAVMCLRPRQRCRTPNFYLLGGLCQSHHAGAHKRPC